jgi:hypothetical protein
MLSTGLHFASESTPFLGVTARQKKVPGARSICMARQQATASRTRKIDPKHAFKMGLMNGRKRRESGRRVAM